MMIIVSLCGKLHDEKKGGGKKGNKTHSIA